jgi:hypothetical protein
MRIMFWRSVGCRSGDICLNVLGIDMSSVFTGYGELAAYAADRLAILPGSQGKEDHLHCRIMI